MGAPPDLPIQASEHAALRAWLQGKGLKPADVAQAVGAGPNGRTRRQVADALAAWLRARPRGA